MKKNYILILLALLWVSDIHAEKRKMLFLGNSYTYVNDLPNTLKQLALSLGDSLDVDSYCPGGSTLQSLYNDANTLAKIQIQGWDYVVVQAQSQEPSFSPAQVEADTYPFAKKLDSLIHITNPCAETVFYMTWGRKNGDAGNCPFYPPVCTYEGMQQRLRESYLEMSNDNNATCSPVGVAWRTFRNAYPLVELYSPDESHPSVNGTYLAACTFYSTLYQKPTTGAAYMPAGVLAADAANIQTIASNTVLDSIENWQQHGSLPRANFSNSINQNQVSFTNSSLRATSYEWDFGDAAPLDNTANPAHTYNTAGNYTVTLKSKNNCNKYSKYSKTINITNIPNAVSDVNADKIAYIYYENGKLFTVGHFKELSVINLSGQVVFTDKSSVAKDFIRCDFLPHGIYFFRAVSQDKRVLTGKFIIN